MWTSHYELIKKYVSAEANKDLAELRNCLISKNIPQVDDPSGYLWKALYLSCKETLGDSFDYSRLAGSDSSFYQTVTSVNLESKRALGREVVTSVPIHEVYHLVCFENAGRKVFEVSGPLAEALRDTELKGLTVEDLRFPYESMVIRVPESLGFKVWGGETGWHHTDEIYVTKDNNKIHVMLIGSSKNLNLTDNAIFYFDVATSASSKVDELKNQLNTSVQCSEPTMAGVWERHFDWAMNVLMYVTSANAELDVRTEHREARDLERRLAKAKGTKRERIRNRLRTLNRQKIIYLGESLTADVAKTASGTRFRVRGHWHRYWTGKGRTELTAKWVKPYWKGEGPETNPVIRLTG